MPACAALRSALPATSEAWIYLSRARLMRKRLAHEEVQPGFHYQQSA
jgi:hypothetical protein